MTSGKNRAMNKKPNTLIAAAELRRFAEARLRVRPVNQRSKTADPKSVAAPLRLLHELQVHQVELEMQNAELHEARDRMETLLEKYTDLYDFAPAAPPCGCSTNCRSTRLNWRCRMRSCMRPATGWRRCWRNTPTSTISRRSGISRWMNRAGSR